MERQQNDGQAGDGIGPQADDHARLVPLSRLQSWALVEGEPDIRGWEVRTLGGRPLGAVGDLLIDGAKREVVLLDIDLPAADRRTFVPVRMVHIDTARHVVVMDSADLPETDSPRAGRAAEPGQADPRAGTVHLPARERQVHRQAGLAPADLPRTGLPSDAPRWQGSSDRRRPDSQRIERLSTEF